MAVDPQLRQQLLELVYEVLPEDDATPLRARIGSEAEIAQAYAEAQTTAAVLASAARLEEPEIRWKRPDSIAPAASPRSVPSVSQKALTRPAAPLRRYWGRMTNWVVGLSAAVLLAISLGGYFFHRGHLADIAADHLRLRVVGPSQLYRGVANRYTMATTSVTGRPVSAQVELALYSPTGDQLMVHKEKTDQDGQLQVVVPADFNLPREARLQILAVHDDKQERVDTRLLVEPVRYRTHLALDRPQYRPGETVRWRSLTVSRFGASIDPALPIRFEIVDSTDMPLPGSALEGTTRHGVGCGEFLLPASLRAGRYVLVARSLDEAFPEVRSGFAVSPEERKLSDGASAATAQPAGAPPATAGHASADLAKLDIRFYPESGELVAGLENRVYFSARDGQGRPAEIRGMVVDSEDHPVAAVETVHAGMGIFSLEPRVGQRYRLSLSSPEGVKELPKLPVVTDGKVILTTGLGVFEPGRPLQFNVRSREEGIPLVAAATSHGVAVGQQALVAKAGANSVEIALDDAVAGVVRLTLYEYRSSPPVPVAERLVYRRPARRLQVRIGDPPQSPVAGGRIRLPVEVSDEEGKPAAAALGVAVDRAAGPPGAAELPSAAAYFLLAEDIDNPAALESTDFFLSDQPKAAVAIDLVLGTEASRRFLKRTSDPKDGSGTQRPALGAPTAPPAVFDNLTDLQQRYRESLESYRANRTRPQNSLTMLSLFGGLGLLLFVTMLAILNIPTGLRLWVPSLSAAVACLVIGAVLMDPERLNTLPPDAIAFASFQAAPAPPAPDVRAVAEA
ncbi:MAG: hypothetical protein HUU20_26180, partial [Pirellulales bacterium]|nr:hypothetical protein [Pirellulales bacterium]